MYLLSLFKRLSCRLKVLSLIIFIILISSHVILVLFFLICPTEIGVHFICSYAVKYGVSIYIYIYILQDWINNTYRSSIAEHLINNRNCTSSNSANLFTILSKSHSDFHVKVLETIHIFTHNPFLCKQKECLLNLNLITIWFTHPFSKQLAFFFSSTLHSPCPLSFLNHVLDLAVISEDRNRLVVKFYFLKMIKIGLF